MLIPFLSFHFFVGTVDRTAIYDNEVYKADANKNT